MKLSLFDLHCDTAFEMLRASQPLTSNTLAVSLEHARVFERYTQVMAHWIPFSLDDEAGWQHFHAMLDNLRRDPALQENRARIVTRFDKMSDTPTLLLALEDARILAGDLSRVDRLFNEGVRILTPLWRGETCIGGSHDTDSGLTNFGRAAIERAIRLGMIPDVSHASVASAEEIFDIAEREKRPVIASHSDAFSVCPVSRNLRDDQVAKILRSDGIIGLNLYKEFLTSAPTATSLDVFPHIEHFLALGAADALCLGGDMDGCDLPPDVQNLSELPKLAEQMLRRNYPESLVRKIFFENAARFAQRYLG